MNKLLTSLLCLFVVFTLAQAAQDTYKQNPYLGKPDNIGQYDKYSSNLNEVGRKFKNYTALATYSSNGRMSKEDYTKLSNMTVEEEVNDFASIQGAIDRAYARGGGIVQLRGKIYSAAHTDNIKVYPGVTLRGMGKGTVHENYTSAPMRQESQTEIQVTGHATEFATASVTEGSKVVTFTGTNFTTADIGKSIILRGCAGDGKDLINRIVSVESTTSITCRVVSGKTDSGVSWFAGVGLIDVYDGGHVENLLITYMDQITSTTPLPNAPTIRNIRTLDGDSTRGIKTVNDVTFRYSYIGLSFDDSHKKSQVFRLKGYCVYIGMHISLGTEFQRFDDIFFSPLFALYSTNYPSYDIFWYTQNYGTSFMFGRNDMIEATALTSWAYGTGLTMFDGMGGSLVQSFGTQHATFTDCVFDSARKGLDISGTVNATFNSPQIISMMTDMMTDWGQIAGGDYAVDIDLDADSYQNIGPIILNSPYIRFSNTSGAVRVFDNGVQIHGGQIKNLHGTLPLPAITLVDAEQTSISGVTFVKNHAGDVGVNATGRSTGIIEGNTFDGYGNGKSVVIAGTSDFKADSNTYLNTSGEKIAFTSSGTDSDTLRLKSRNKIAGTGLISCNGTTTIAADTDGAFDYIRPRDIIYAAGNGGGAGIDYAVSVVSVDTVTDTVVTSSAPVFPTPTAWSYGPMLAEYKTEGVTISSLRHNGVQDWYLKGTNTGTDGGRIVYSSPGGGAGFNIFTGPNGDQNRFDMYNASNIFTAKYNSGTAYLKIDGATDRVKVSQIEFADSINQSKAVNVSGGAGNVQFSDGNGYLTSSNNFKVGGADNGTITITDLLWSGNFPQSFVKNSLSDTSTDKALSAAQGKSLNDKFGTVTSNYIPYWSGSALTTSNAYYDVANTRIGIGNTSPQNTLHVTSGSVPAKFERTSTGTSLLSTFFALHTTTASAADGIGSGINFQLATNGVSATSIGLIGAVRDGANNSGALSFQPYVTGTPTEKMRLASNGLQTFSNGGGPPFGNMFTDTALVVTVLAANTWYEVNTGATDFTAGLLKNVTHSDHYLVATTAGYYQVEACASLGTGVAGYKVAINTAVNGTAASYGHGHTTIANANSTSQACALNILNLAANDQVSIVVQNHSGSSNIDVDHAQMKMVYIGSP